MEPIWIKYPVQQRSCSISSAPSEPWNWKDHHEHWCVIFCALMSTLAHISCKVAQLAPRHLKRASVQEGFRFAQQRDPKCDTYFLQNPTNVVKHSQNMSKIVKICQNSSKIFKKINNFQNIKIIQKYSKYIRYIQNISKLFKYIQIISKYFKHIHNIQNYSNINAG